MHSSAKLQSLPPSLLLFDSRDKVHHKSCLDLVTDIYAGHEYRYLGLETG